MLIGEASIRIDAMADDLKRTINRDINDALKGVKIDSDPLVQMTQNLRKAELDLITAEDALTASHRGVLETEARLEDLRRSGTATTREITVAERDLIRARAQEAVVSDKVTTANLRLASAHGQITKATTAEEVQRKSWIRNMLGSSSVIDSVVGKLDIFRRKTRDTGDETTRTGSKLRRAGDDASGLGKVLDGSLKGILGAVTGQMSGLGQIGSGVFGTLTSKAVLLPAAIAPLLGVIGGLIIALPALAAVGGVALGAILLGLDGIKRAFKPLADDLTNLKTKVSASFESALAPAVAKMPALFGAATTGLQAMATALGGMVTRLTTMLTTSQNLAKIRDLFIQTAFFIKAMGPGIQQFTQGFLNLASAVAPQLEKLGASIGGLLGSIGGAFDRLNQLGLVKPAIEGLIRVFDALGQLLGPVLEIFGRLAATLQGPLATVISAIATGLQAAMPGIQAFADGIGKALISLAPALQAILPLVGQVAGLIGGVLGVAIATLAPPLTKLIVGLTTGLAPILPRIAAAFDALSAALAPVLDQLSTALIQAFDAIIPLIPQLLDAIVQLIPAFLQIATAIIPLIPPLAQLISTILPPLIKLWVLIEKPMLDFSAVLVGQVVPALISIVNVASDVVTKVANFFENFNTNIKIIWGKIVGFFKGIGEAIAGFFSGIGNKIVGWFQTGVDFLSGLPAKVGNFLSSLPGIVAQWMSQAARTMADALAQGIEWVIAEFIALPFQIIAVTINFGVMLWQWMVSAFEVLRQAVLDGSLAVVHFFQALPGRIMDAVSSLWGSFKAWWDGLWRDAHTAVRDGIATVVQFFRELPGRALAAVRGLLGDLRSFLISVMRGAWEAIRSGVDSILGFFRALPGQILGAISSLGSAMYNAGRNIIIAIVNGIKSAAGAVWSAVEGIMSKVRKLLPFSPAKEGPFSGRGWTLYSGMAISQALADGIRLAGDQAITQAAQLAAAVQAAIGLTPTIGTPTFAGAGIPDQTQAAAATQQAQLAAVGQLASTLTAQGKTLPADLAAAMESLRVVVSATEVASGVKTVEQQNQRRR